MTDTKIIKPSNHEIVAEYAGAVRWKNITNTNKILQQEFYGLRNEDDKFGNMVEVRFREWRDVPSVEP